MIGDGDIMKKILICLLVLIMLGSCIYAYAVTEPVEYFDFDKEIEMKAQVGKSDIIIGEDPEGIYKAEIEIGGI